jgi:hypothetical protein
MLVFSSTLTVVAAVATVCTTMSISLHNQESLVNNGVDATGIDGGSSDRREKFVWTQRGRVVSAERRGRDSVIYSNEAIVFEARHGNLYRYGSLILFRCNTF